MPTSCVFPGCDRLSARRQLCTKHWQSERLAGRLSQYKTLSERYAERIEKRCSVCGEIKPMDQFHLIKHTRGGIYPQGRCKTCNQTICNEWREKNRDRFNAVCRKYQLKKKYGLSVASYGELLKAQNHTCAICQQSTDKRLSVDHRHSDGKVRGLLCHSCNVTIGWAKDDVRILRRMIHYLTRD